MSENQNGGSASGNGALRVQAIWERQAVAASGGESTLLLRVTAAEAAGPRAAVDVAVVIDRSGSMNGGKLDLAKRAVGEVLGRLQPEDRAAVVVFDDQVEVVEPAGAVTPRLVAVSLLRLEGIAPRGSTALAAGWQAGAEQVVGDAPGRLRRVLLLTDGQANVGETRPEVLAWQAAALRQRGVSTTTLGLGLGFNEALLAAMAEAGGGNFEFVEDAAALPAFFRRELRELLAVRAAGVEVAVDLPAGTRAECLNQLPTWPEGNRLTVSLGDLPAGAVVDLVLRLSHERSAVDTVHTVRTTTTWTDPASGQPGEVSRCAPRLLTFPDYRLETVWADPAVSEAAALLLVARGQREAAQLDREGRHAESRARVRQARVALAAAPVSPRTDEARELLVRFEADQPYDEVLRKQAYWDSSRRARGRDREAGPDAA